MTVDRDEESALRQVTERLTREYAGLHSEAEVQAATEKATDQFHDSRIRAFIPILVERSAREILGSLKGKADRSPSAPAAAQLEGT